MAVGLEKSRETFIGRLFAVLVSGRHGWQCIRGTVNSFEIPFLREKPYSLLRRLDFAQNIANDLQAVCIVQRKRGYTNTTDAAQYISLLCVLAFTPTMSRLNFAMNGIPAAAAPSGTDSDSSASPARGKAMVAALHKRLRPTYPLVHQWEFWHDRQDRKSSPTPSSNPSQPASEEVAYEDRLVKLARSIGCSLCDV